jgi:D-threo-aldose 1-dehydrogenase
MSAGMGATRPLGRSAVQVTRMVLGCAPLAGLFAPVSNEMAQATLEAAWASGVHSFDTAPHYAVGMSESRLGQFLSRHPGEGAVVSTKVGRLLVPTDDDVEGAENFYGTPQLGRILDYSRDGVRRSIESSCERLGLEHIDIALVHDPDDHFAEALDQALPALADMRAEGIVGAVGLGMNQSAMLARFVRQADLDCVLVAGRFSLLDPSAGEELLPVCQERGVGVLVAGVFNSGILVNPGPGATYEYAPASAERLATARRLQDICGRHGVALRTAALQWPLRHPAVTAVVVGARSPDEAGEDAADLGRPVPDDLWAELAEAC